MPWCPKCKVEYRDDIKICADCKIELINELPFDDDYVCIFKSDKEELRDKLAAYLVYSKIEPSVKEVEGDDKFAIFVSPNDLKKAKKACSVFAYVEAERIAKEKLEHESNSFTTNDELESNNNDDLSDDNLVEDDFEFVNIEDISSDSNSFEFDANTLNEEELLDKQSEDNNTQLYVKKADQSKELKSTAITFYVFGVLLFGFMCLNYFGVISIFAGTIPLICLLLLSIGCIIVGINSQKRAKKAASDAIDEEQLTCDLTKWLSENITEEFLAAFDKEDYTDEENYIERTESVKKLIIDTFGGIDESYLDSIIEEFYNEHF